MERGCREPGSLGEGELREVIEFANAVATLITTARRAIPTREGVEALLTKTKGGRGR